MKRRILVVEDNPLNSELLRDWLELQGYEVSDAADLNAACAILESREVHAVLLDVQLGADDGLRLVPWIRARPAVSGLPVIAVTAQAMPTEQQRIRESGCNSLVSKPIDFKSLREELEGWLGHSRGPGKSSLERTG